jgi:O-antigen/teichoic acid export membrane protein
MNIWLFRAGPILLKIFGKAEADKLAGLFAAIVMPLNIIRLMVMSLQAGLYPNLSRAYSIKNNALIKRYIFKSFSIIIGIIVILLPIYYFYGPKIILLIYRKQEFLVSRLDTTLLALAYSFYFLGLHLTKILMARDTPGYSSLSLAIGIIGMIITLLVFELPAMQLVGLSLLVCNLIYCTIQGLFLLIVKVKKIQINS